jgi:hypothetical protein
MPVRFYAPVLNASLGFGGQQSVTAACMRYEIQEIYVGRAKRMLGFETREKLL